MNRPKPDWGRKGTQPKGELGPPPGPNGRVVATQPDRSTITIGVRSAQPTIEAGTLPPPPQAGRRIAALRAEDV